MIDVDHFKAFNDAHGHQAGDEVLQRLATVLTSTLRQEDVAARYGGEEFVVVLPETPLTEAVRAAERVRERLAVERFGPDRQVVTLSVGVAEYPATGDTTDAVLSAADGALYKAKARGRDAIATAGATAPASAPAAERAPRRRKKKAT